MKGYLVLFTLLIFLFFVPHTFATADLPTVSVVNPLRGTELGLEKSNLLQSLKSQWTATKKTQVKATWLWQYSALEEREMMKFAKNQMKDQEFGIFLEIDKNFADKAGVGYKGESSWYFSDGLLLVSYDQFEREKLIKKVFDEFKKTFGYYPKTVGAWWVGAESISFMQKEYGITGVIQCSDQFGTDAYSLWGTPWSIPYRPSKYSAAVPASSLGSSSNVVIMQWAPRDPVRGYGKDQVASTFSMQDYPIKGYDSSYIDYLANIYLKESLDQIVIGLEGGLPPSSYEGIYAEQLIHLKKLQNQKRVTIRPVSEYADDFLQSKSVLPPTHYFLAQDYLTKDQSFWMNTPSYRVGIKKEGNQVFLLDIRDYKHTLSEDFYKEPNLEGMLRINTRSVIDSIRFPEQKLRLADTSRLSLSPEGKTVVLKAENRTIGVFAADDYSLPALSLGEQKKLLLTNQKLPSLGYQLLQKPTWTVGLISLLYLIALIFQKLPRKTLLISLSLLIISFITMYPFFSSWYTPDGSIVFSTLALPVLVVATWLPFSLPIKLLVIFQLLPDLLLLMINYGFVLMRKRGPIIWVVYLFILFLFAVFTSQSYQALIQIASNGKKGLLLGIFIVGTAGVLWSTLLFLSAKAKWGNRVLLGSGVLIGICLIFAYPKLVTEKRIIITPFEMEALTFLSDHHELITFLEPESDLQYRAVTPLLYADTNIPAVLLHNKWEVIQDINSHTNGLMVIPRYLKREILPEQIEKYHLKKVFDNAQIEIYSRE